MAEQIMVIYYGQRRIECTQRLGVKILDKIPSCRRSDNLETEIKLSSNNDIES